MALRSTSVTEFSRIVLVDGLGTKGRRFAVAADAGERAALAKRLEVVEIARLDVAGESASVRGGTVVRLAAHLSADVTQSCVVTLAPIPRRIEADFVRLYAHDAGEEAEPGTEIYYDESDDDIDPLLGGRLDVGEAAAEQLALELDPYPRAPGAVLEGDELAGIDLQRIEGPANPFADLAKLSAAKDIGKKRK